MRSSRPRGAAQATLAAAIAATLLASSRAEAQHQTQLAISGGVATDQRGVRSDALTVAPSVLLVPSADASLSVDASVTRFGTEAWSLGGGAAFSGREKIAGPVAFTFDASANVSRLQGQENASASFASGELLPAMQLDAGPLTLFGGARVATGYGSQDAARPSLPGFAGTTMQSQTRSGVGPAFGISFTAASPAGGTLRLGAREDRLRVSGVNVADRALSAHIATNAMRLTGSVGRRYASDEQVAFGSAAISFSLRSDVALDVAAGRYASNRLIGTPGGDYFNAGLSFRFGGATAARSAPWVHGAPTVARGYTRLTIEARDAKQVDVAGDFNEWKPVAAQRAENGIWYADLSIAPGQYRYAFRVNGKEWRVPRGATAVEDGFGGKSAWLTVGETGS
jgi:hypothetical protein